MAAIIWSLALSACGTPATPPHALVTPPAQVEDPFGTSPAATPTLAPRIALLYRGQTAERMFDPSAISASLASLAGESGWIMKSDADLGEIDPMSVAILVSLASELPAAFTDQIVPSTPILWIGEMEGSEAANSYHLVLPSRAKERQALLAGYTAALMTQDWRVAAITSSQEPAIRQNILDGARYMCGLCRATAPPFANYPLSFQVGAQPDPAAIDQLQLELKRSGVRTVVLSPLAADPALITSLDQEGIVMIGMETPNLTLPDSWAATVRYAPELILPDAWQVALLGTEQGTTPIPLAIIDRNPEHLSDARLRLVEETLESIDRGLIAPAPAAGD